MQEMIAQAVGGMSLIVHHSTKAGDTSRGGYALDCDTDTRLRLDKGAGRREGGVREAARRRRSRYFTLRVQKVDLGERYPNGSLVLRWRGCDGHHAGEATAQGR